MADAKKCDICGRFYELYGCQRPFTSNANAFVFLYEDSFGEYKKAKYKGNTYMDCCKDCIDAIAALVDDLGKPGEESSEPPTTEEPEETEKEDLEDGNGES